MSTLETLRQALPEAAKDIKLNLEAVLAESSLSEEQRWGVAVASAIATRNAELSEATYQAAKQLASPEALDDAVAAASLMAMNNVYYRSKHMVGREEFSKKPARLRMNRIAKPASEKLNFELYALAVSAINGCDSCIRAHDKGVLHAGLSDEHVHDTLRIASAFQGAAVAYEASKFLSHK